MTLAALALAFSGTMAMASITANDVADAYKAKGYTVVSITTADSKISIHAVKGNTAVDVVYDAKSGAILKQSRGHATAREAIAGTVAAGNDSVEGGDDSVEGGDDSVSGGDDSVEGGDDSVSGGDDSVEGGDDSVSGGSDDAADQGDDSADASDDEGGDDATGGTTGGRHGGTAGGHHGRSTGDQGDDD